MRSFFVFAGIAALSVSVEAGAQQAAAVGITRAQAEAQAAQQFAQLDANGDGQLAPAEVEQFFAKQAEEPRQRMGGWRQRMEGLSPEERRQRMEERMKQLSPEERARVEARRAERRGDASGGQRMAELSPEERRQRIEERMKQLSPEERARFEARRAERRAGSGGQRARFTLAGPVSLAQFKEQALARFDRLDTDRDGTVSAAEQAAAGAPRTQGSPE